MPLYDYSVFFDYQSFSIILAGKAENRTRRNGRYEPDQMEKRAKPAFDRQSYLMGLPRVITFVFRMSTEARHNTEAPERHTITLSNI